MQMGVHCDTLLFKALLNSTRRVHQQTILLPPVSCYVLHRQRSHPCELIEHKYQKIKCSYIVRSIFEYIYICV